MAEERPTSAQTPCVAGVSGGVLSQLSERRRERVFEQIYEPDNVIYYRPLSESTGLPRQEIIFVFPGERTVTGIAYFLGLITGKKVKLCAVPCLPQAKETREEMTLGEVFRNDSVNNIQYTVSP